MEPGGESGGQLSADELIKIKQEEVDRQIGELNDLQPADKIRAVESKRQELIKKGMNTDNMSPEEIIMQFVNTESEGM